LNPRRLNENAGPAKIEGNDTVDGKAVPAVFSGATKTNNNFTLVDEKVREVGVAAQCPEQGCRGRQPGVEERCKSGFLV
jgi:hypothetical protein